MIKVSKIELVKMQNEVNQARKFYNEGLISEAELAKAHRKQEFVWKYSK